MPTIQEIEAAVAQLKRENKRISLRNVRAALPRGGSYSDIGRLLHDWKEKENYDPKKISEEIPESLRPLVAEFATRLWMAARGEAEKIVELDRANQRVLKQEFEKEALIAWEEIDRLREQIILLRRKLAGIDTHSDPPAFKQPTPPTMMFTGIAGPAIVENSLDDNQKRKRGYIKGSAWGFTLDQMAARRKANYSFKTSILSLAADMITASERGALTAAEIIVGLPSELRVGPVDYKPLDIDGLGRILSHGRIKHRLAGPDAQGLFRIANERDDD